MPRYRVSYYDKWAGKRDHLDVWADNKRAAIKRANYSGTTNLKARRISVRGSMKLLPREAARRMRA